MIVVALRVMWGCRMIGLEVGPGALVFGKLWFVVCCCHVLSPITTEMGEPIAVACTVVLGVS